MNLIQSSSVVGSSAVPHNARQSRRSRSEKVDKALIFLVSVSSTACMWFAGIRLLIDALQGVEFASIGGAQPGQLFALAITAACLSIFM